MAKGNLPVSPNLDPQLRRFLQQINEKLEVGEGQRGDPLQSYLKKQDLLDLGFAKLIRSRSGQIVNGGNLVPSIPVPNMSVPPAPKGFSASAGLTHVFLEWEDPQSLYSNHAYTLILRNTEDNIANASIIAQAAVASLYADLDVSYGVNYYYWIRFVSTAGVSGSPNSSVGTLGAVSEDPTELLERLEGKITSLELSADLNAYVDNLADQYTLKIGQNGVVAGFGLAFTGPDYNPSNPYHSIAIFNVDTFAITHPSTGGTSTLAFSVENGKVVMDGASIKHASIGTAQVGQISVEKITGVTSSFLLATIGEGKITNAYIGNFIQSNNYVANTSGWRLDKESGFELNGVAGSGRTRIRPTTYEVFSSSGVRLVRMGAW